LESADSDDLFPEMEEEEFNLSNLEERDNADDDVDYHKVANKMSEKSAALTCLGAIAEFHSQAFAEYIEPTVQVLLSLVGCEIAPHVSSSALDSMVQMCNAVKKLTQPDLKFERGVVFPLSAELETMCVATVEAACSTFLIPDDIIVRGALDSIGKLGTEIGPVIYTNHIKDIENFLVALLNRQAPCQTVCETFDEGSEDDFAIFASTMELMYVDFSSHSHLHFYRFTRI
jgi:hypothetical protein